MEKDSGSNPCHTGNRLVSIGTNDGVTFTINATIIQRRPDTNAFETFQRELDHADVVDKTSSSIYRGGMQVCLRW